MKINLPINVIPGISNGSNNQSIVCKIHSVIHKYPNNEIAAKGVLNINTPINSTPTQIRISTVVVVFFNKNNQ